MAAACGAAGTGRAQGLGTEPLPTQPQSHGSITQVHHAGIHSALLERLLCTRPCCMCQRNTAVNKRDKNPTLVAFLVWVGR